MLRLALHWQILIGMVVGAAIGIGLNHRFSERVVDLDQAGLPRGVVSFHARDSVNRIELSWRPADGEERKWVIDPSRAERGSLASLSALAAKDARAAALFQQYGRSPARQVGDVAQRLGNLFLRMLQMVAVPLIVSSLITGVTGLGHVSRLGKMFARTLIYYLATSMLAILSGIMLVRVLRPGLRGGLQVAEEAVLESTGSLSEVLFRQLETLIPSNPIAALAAPEFLSIISFSLAFAIFALTVGGKTLDVIKTFFEAVFEVMMSMTNAVIRLAPIGVLFLMVYVTATQGPDVFRSLFWYMLTVFLALALHAVVVLPLILHLVAGTNPWRYAQALSPALLTAFSSASSNGTLPLTMSCVEERAGISNRISSFVLPLGATINMDGTALYEAVAVMFIAELYQGYDLSLAQQVVVAFTALLASIGAAGIPHAGLVMMVIILQAVGLPIEMQGVILAVDRVLDMCRTSVNVWSDACGCAVVNRLEGEVS